MISIFILREKGENTANRGEFIETVRRIHERRPQPHINNPRYFRRHRRHHHNPHTHTHDPVCFVFTTQHVNPIHQINQANHKYNLCPDCGECGYYCYHFATLYTWRYFPTLYVNSIKKISQPQPKLYWLILCMRGVDFLPSIV
jgi:hypothetical protein